MEQKGCCPVISIEADVSIAMRYLSPKEREEWIIELLETIREDGEITKIREIVNKSKWDEQ